MPRGISTTYGDCGSGCSETAFLQNVAWRVADQLGWPDTLDAEYVALTQLQADAFITLNRQLAESVKDLVVVAPIETLS